MRIAFLGVGQVGAPLAVQLQRLGHTVTIAAREPASASVRAALEREPALTVAAPLEAVDQAELVVLATPWSAVAGTLPPLAAALAGTVLVDATNPVGPELSHGLASRTSGAEEVQRLVPAAKVVKAFSTVGYENLEDSTYPGHGSLRPAMLLAGDNPAACATVAELCEELGWEPVVAGPLRSSLQLEHLALLWIRMARLQGMGADFVWALLRRPAAGTQSAMSLPEAGSGTGAMAAREAIEEEAKAVVRAYVEAFNRGDLEALEALLSDEAEIQGVRGWGGFAQVAPIWRQLIEGYGIQLEVQSLIAEGNQVMARFLERGTFRAPAFGAEPTGRSYELVAFESFEIEGGRIRRRWGARDSASQARQLGLTPEA